MDDSRFTKAMYFPFKNRFRDWIFRPHGAESGAVVLGQRRVFIVPTRQGVAFAVVLVLLLTGSINYNLSLGYVLTFLLAAMGIVAMLHTFRNLGGLRLSAARASPVFAGEHARFTICIDNPGATDRYRIGLTRDHQGTAYTDVPARRSALLDITVAAPRRGLLRPGKLTLFTRYPLGLYHAWAYFEPDVQCTVYPRPAPAGLALPAPENVAGPHAGRGAGREDFAGLRPYHAGDSPRHIAWKAAARGQGLLTKQFGGRGVSEVWLAWESLPARMGFEEKLSHLARWVLDAHASGMPFGLRLPGKTIAIAGGDAQRGRCLEALARFEPGTAHP
ncbi:MAG: DUF58 domain-containing protein [Burkholderiales bacterium]